MNYPEGYYQEVIFGNDIFVMVGKGNKIAYSVDGHIWNEKLLIDNVFSIDNNMEKYIAFGADRFVIIISDAQLAYHSKDGINWSSMKLPIKSGKLIASWSSITYANKRFIATSTYPSQMIASKDGVNWKFVEIDESMICGRVFSIRNEFIMINNASGKVWSSSTGLEWNDVSAMGVQWDSIYECGNKLIGTRPLLNKIYIGDDNVIDTYEKEILYGEEKTYPRIGAEFKGTYIVGGKHIMISEDCENWLRITLPYTDNDAYKVFKSVAKSDDVIVVLDSTNIQIYSSVNGEAWNNSEFL